MGCYQERSDYSTAEVEAGCLQIDNLLGMKGVALVEQQQQRPQQQLQQPAVVGVAVGGTTVAGVAAPVDVGAAPALSQQMRVSVWRALPAVAVVVVAVAANVVVVEAAVDIAADATDVARGRSETKFL